MKRYDLLTPEGTRDLLFDECIARRSVQEHLRSVFTSYGYSEVVTPGLEFFDVFNGKVRYFPQETMYKLVDGKNRMMVLRPDNTMPIARLAATRLKGERLPLKLFYNQSIFMVNPKNSGRDDEFTQSGIEILGGKSAAADFEALSLAAQCVSEYDEEFRLEIGDSGIFRSIIAELDPDDEQADLLLELIETKNYPALKEALAEYSGEAAEALMALPSLFGGVEVFEAAEKYMYTHKLKTKLSALRETFDALSAVGLEGKVKVDLGLVHKKNYYTGIIFRGYVEGYGLPVVSGGRYDTLIGDFGRDVTAVGFAVNVEALARVYLKSVDAPLITAPDVLVYSNSHIAAIRHCRKLAEQGMTVFNSVFATEAEAVEYARSSGIKRIDIVDDDGKVNVKEI